MKNLLKALGKLSRAVSMLLYELLRFCFVVCREIPTIRGVYRWNRFWKRYNERLSIEREAERLDRLRRPHLYRPEQ